ncbi:MAG: dihydrofolate reductase [Candidatus Poribacteria bacterium]|nr:dihydrofolate reductase [Candidatus Poribacteria bacterium]
MLISMIAAMDKNRLIGNGPNIPWQMPVDRRHFRDMTVGKPVVMGRKTFETLKRPLGKRHNIILTRNTTYKAPKGCNVAHSVRDVLELCKEAEELMICGGAPIYEAFLPHANRLYLTQIHATFEGDVYFPEFDSTAWEEVKRIDGGPDERNPYPYSFLFLERK